jgi:3-hydroxyisobutyrate dehydrogenase-like beta-hydroxyacid dehydrogenase
MGGGMAANLIRAGYRLIVNDLEPGKVEALLARASVT